MRLVFIVVALAAGTLIPVQGSLNARLGKTLPHPLQSSLTNFLVGSLVLLLLLLVIRAPWPTYASLAAVPPQLFLGGVIGVIFVSAVLILIPQIGVLNVLASALVGQLLVSILIDHFGWFGVPTHSLSLSRIVGALSLVIGLFLIQR